MKYIEIRATLENGTCISGGLSDERFNVGDIVPTQWGNKAVVKVEAIEHDVEGEPYGV